MLSSGLPAVSSSTRLHEKEDNDEKIWTRLLAEVSAKGRCGLPAAVIALGDDNSGNFTLVDKLTKKPEGTVWHRSSLECHPIAVQADTRDGSYAYQLGTAGQLGPADSTTLPVWLLDGSEYFAPLLSHALPTSSPSRLVAVLCASLEHPGTIIHSLRRWAAVLSQAIVSKYDSATLKEARTAQERFWQEYVEPVESSMTASIMQGIEDHLVVELDKGVLTENTGASIVVVLTKSDLAGEMNTRQWERIMVQVRRFCLQWGAALMCVSSKKGQNVQQLYKYVVHRAYGLGFTAGAQIIERETVFVPAGWDSDKKIDIIKESAGDVDTLEPTREKPVIKEQLIEAEDDQTFLARMMALQMADAPISKKATVPQTCPAPSTRTPTSLSSRDLASLTPSLNIDRLTSRAPLAEDGGTTGGAASAADSNTALASFFSNLLKPQQGKSPSAAAATPLDPAAQLARLAASAKTPASATSSSESNA